jgi:hypothetical protein
MCIQKGCTVLPRKNAELERDNFSFLIKPTGALISQIYFVKKLHVLGSSSAHHQEFFTVHSALVYVMQF